MSDINRIKAICSSAAEGFASVAAKGVRNNYILDIDSRDMEDYLSVNIINSDVYQSSKKFNILFDSLTKISGPCVYWFEFHTPLSNNELIDRFLIYKDSIGCRAVPAIKNRVDITTKTLYVGKVKSKFWGRLIQHLGYHKTAATQGLQLYHWCKGIPIKFRIQVYEFENDMAELVPIVESAMAKELKPLIGKHL